MTIIILFLKLYFFLLKFIIIKSKETNETKLSPNIAVIPFKTFYIPNKNKHDSFTSKEYLDNIHSSLSYLEIEIGKDIKREKVPKDEEDKIKNNKQYISLFFNIDEYNFYIDDNYFYDKDKKSICRYSTQLSTSYEVSPTNNNKDNNIKDSIYATDYFKFFSDISLTHNNMIKIEYKYSYDKNNNISFACGKVGLLAPSNKLYMYYGLNFINQIHNNLENVDYSFTLKYNYNKNINEMNDGLLIIGAESYEKHKNKELIQTYNKPNSYGSIDEWRFEVDEITIGNQLFEFNDEEFVIKSNIEGIEIPYSFYSELNKIYFNNYYKNNICKYEIVNNIYLAISCNSDLFTKKDIEIFPELNFIKYKLGFNFTFSGEELFYKRDNNYFFKMIAYLERFKKDFRLGRIFLKKYQIIFNSDSKSMYFYKFNNEIQDNDNDKIVNNNIQKNNVFLIVFSYIFIGVLFLGAGIYFGRKYCIMRRKKYANELEDNNYVYESKSKGIKKDQKLIEL